MRPRREALLVAAVLVFTTLVAATPAHAAFGVDQGNFTASVFESNGTTAVTHAGAHPYEGVTEFQFNTFAGMPDGNVKDIRVDLPPGLISNPQVTDH